MDFKANRQAIGMFSVGLVAFTAFGVSALTLRLFPYPSSPGNHTARHLHELGRPVKRFFELGEAWRWCYVDDLLG